ncbi:YidC/Oxa1 family membrane protein insertase [Rubrobacter aplysinae]|uniref:YidC/Oxa1 family membrane protein insertase n=1 Tax=Rubrobacter aplysinae TaxID=909625 RepID=UPI00069E2E2C|nr:membrane protein insertase YidC [Rubrobacter aplysinae]
MVEFFSNLFHPMIVLLGGILTFFHGLGAPWWLAIALLTIVVRGVLFPLTVKQVKSMRQMQELRPKLKEIQDKHSGDRQKLQEEQMKLYQETGVNPVGGCLPLLIQMPIFIGIFYTIREFGGTSGMIGVPDTAGTIESFTSGGMLWFQNLSQPDPLFLLPVISAVTMLGSMEMTNKQMEPQMRWVMRLMPIVFVFFTIFFPAGLLVYIVTSNLVTVFQNYLIYYRGPGRQDAAETGSAGDTNGKQSGKAGSTSSADGNSANGSGKKTSNGVQSSQSNKAAQANGHNGGSQQGGSKQGSSSSKRRKKKKKKN